MEKMTMSKLSRSARAYLLSCDGVSAEDLDAHLQNWRLLRRHNLTDIYRSFLHHAKNRQGIPNTIGDIDRLKKVFFGFDPSKVVAQYQEHTDILNQIIEQEVEVAGQINQDNQRSHWVIYAKSALSSAKFLQAFPDAQAFHNFVQSFLGNQYTLLALPLLLKAEIFGFGFALACDFIKENGYSEFVKPDTHLNDICRAAGISAAQTDVGIFKDVVAYCSKHNLVPYEFDKLIWMIGSGDLYLRNRSFHTNKNAFIDTWMERDG